MVILIIIFLYAFNVTSLIKSHVTSNNDFPTNTTLYFSNPTAIQLDNKDILVIHQNGIVLCDPDFTKIKKLIEEFPEENKISATELPQVYIKNTTMVIL